ncbi:hypothetical protein [Photobacterium phosphoreum]|uniref:hypothetical protein n=1 Tax=Photobacterium phosphoreum TaxID=659 RepID=UPI001E56B994|nr:hypothetical protein [Photobacterium phosphoreum]MCD9511946.1 hypothetical protein [Photobacterium phosphoreum]
MLDVVLVPDDFYTLLHAPKLGYEYKWVDFEKGIHEECKITYQGVDFKDKYEKVDSTRRALYFNQVDPLIAEAGIKKALGLDKEVVVFIRQALALRAKIQQENPWPEIINHG